MNKVEWLAQKWADLDETEKTEFLQARIAESRKRGFISKNFQTIRPKLALMSDYTNKAREHYNNFGKMVGISTGFSTIDELTHGLASGELVVIAGKTSEGKTTLAINIANKVALANIPVLFVTLEMTKEEITSRYMYINGGETDAYNDVACRTVVQEDDELNWKSIDDLIAVAKEEMKVGLVIIDHLHYLTRELDNVTEDLGRITKEFKKNAIRHELPIVLISHVRKTNDIMPNMEDLRGSSLIAQDADIVLMVGREPGIANKMLVRIEKNRNRGFDRDNATIELYTDRIKLIEDVQAPIYELSRIFKESEIVKTSNELFPN